MDFVNFQMSENNDIAGSDDVISLNYESQETFKYLFCFSCCLINELSFSSEHSFRIKQSANRFDKNVPVKGY